MSGPLKGVRVVELAGIGPAPFACMMLADMGADVLRLDRLRTGPEDDWWLAEDILSRGRRSVEVDLKDPAGAELVAGLCETADVLVEGFRPGVAERLGLGPEPLRARNPRLVYGRMTGWGQDGPLADRAGHDINYTALTGALHAIGPADGPPVPPLNLLGDFGGGGLLLAFGLVSGLFEARRSGHGQVVDAAMIDGVSLLMAWPFTLRNAGRWNDARGSNLLDGGAPNYTAYETADGAHVAVGAMEPKFLLRLLSRLGLPAELAGALDDPAEWPAVRDRIAGVFRTRTRAQWEGFFAGDDVCATPVLSMGEAAGHPQLRAREVLHPTAHGYQPAPAPRFSRTAPSAPGGPTLPGSGGAAALADWGVPESRVSGLRDRGVVRTRD
ncbi:CoA transferase [Actinomadura sp. KC345]|uniref:CaiB/BaiF CoA transferase family protein n=1 Tax=Actinomadura sp. KC345 TaxID=2530371 RepID=UPI001047482C|nr:CaiB/BaiF CoA-transferase family protein [Actinomadura sp. KC345]TDC57434.1 CoA transferase [Actinomadura sp. KC345]